MHGNCIGAVSDYGTYIINKNDNSIQFNSFSPSMRDETATFEGVKELAEDLNRKHYNLIGLAVTHEQSGD
jgi:hypothetical protein